MNTLELLYNKALMKAAADKDEQVKKGKVWFTILKYLNIILSNMVPPISRVKVNFIKTLFTPEYHIPLYLIFQHMSYGKPQPERFELYTELPNKKGFTIKDSKLIFKYDQYGGWKD